MNPRALFASACVLLGAGLLACAAQDRPAHTGELASNDSSFKMSPEGLRYKGELFTGTTVDRWQVRRETPYVNGKIHGVMQEFHPDGRLASERRHENGEKVGLHRGWWPDGKMRFYEHYENGRRHGEFWNWSNQGLLVEYAVYENGDEIGRKKWRRSGTIYANYVYTPKRLLGLAGGRLCFKIEANQAPGSESPVTIKK